MTTDERRDLYARLVRDELRKLTPSMPGRYSGQQVAYAKGRAGRHFVKVERERRRKG